MSDSKLLNSIVDETANLGKVTTSISFIISIIIGVIFIIVAIYFGVQRQKPSVKALIKISNCETETKISNNRKVISYRCLLKLIYTINNIDYINDLSVNSYNVYNPNSYIDIEYDESNPNNINLKGLDNTSISSISMGIALVLVGFSFVNYYLTNQSKTYASLQGMSSIGSFFGSKTNKY